MMVAEKIAETATALPAAVPAVFKQQLAMAQGLVRHL
jgi:hypothetical protein